MGDRIYVVGGWDGFKRLDTCEVYIPKERRWTRIPSMSTPRSNHSLEFIENCLLLVDLMEMEQRPTWKHTIYNLRNGQLCANYQVNDLLYSV